MILTKNFSLSKSNIFVEYLKLCSVVNHFSGIRRNSVENHLDIRWFASALGPKIVIIGSEISIMTIGSLVLFFVVGFNVVYIAKQLFDLNISCITFIPRVNTDIYKFVLF